MATCLNSFSSGQTFIELSSKVTYTENISPEKNAVFILSNELPQSVFFNIVSSGTGNTVAISLTIYNMETLAIFGTMNITNRNVNTSFTISEGRYYVCIRPLVGSYEIKLTPSFISYSNNAILSATSYIGYHSSGKIEIEKKPSFCNRPLKYELIDGILPPGLKLLDNGIVVGTLPMLDDDDYNKDLPTSSSWYHKISDSEYITSWGRAYRFKARLSLQDDDSKTDEEWFYISVVNNFSKNKLILDKYAILDDDKAVTFEDRVVLDTINLCPPCDLYVDKPGQETKEISLKDINENGILTLDSYKRLIEKGVDQNNMYNILVDHVVEEDEVVLFSNSMESYLEEDEDTEMIIYPERNMSNNIEAILSWYMDKNNDDSNFTIILKDSCMFQTYLKEKNISGDYIIKDSLERFNYSGISIKFEIVDGIEYMVLRNTIDENIKDTSELFNEDYLNNYLKLPLTTYSFHGFYSLFKLEI